MQPLGILHVQMEGFVLDVTILAKKHGEGQLLHRGTKLVNLVDIEGRR